MTRPMVSGKTDTVQTQTQEAEASSLPDTAAEVFSTSELAVYYGEFRAVREVNLTIRKQQITALIGPSGCGKSTVIRCFDRMNDLIPEARVEGEVLYHGIDLYGPKVDAVEVRRRIGMVFQKPNPFPKSIYDNLAFGPRLNGVKKRAPLDDIVESALTRAALWDEVKDRLKASAMGLSGGQQQRLCIARCIAVDPEVILMDEPCSALDPIATARIEELMQEIKTRVHDHHRHPQHAAGGTGQRLHGVLHHRGQRGERSPHRRARRVQPHGEDLLQPRRRAHRAVRDGKVRLMTDDLDISRPEEEARGDLRTRFHHALDEIRSEIASLGATVTENIPRATEILLSQDLEGAEYMILADDAIDAASLELEDRCYSLLALQAPVASDLRQVVAALRIIAEIERSADLATNLCKAARRIYGHELDPKLRGIIQKMGDQAMQLFKEATESYLAGDSARAAAIDDMDGYLDDLQREFVQAIFETHRMTKVDLQVAVQLAIVARFYERIGDHAVNIGERTQFVATGWVRESVGAVRHATRQAASDVE